jgi:hypothetical protein
MARMTVRADISELQPVDQRILMFRLGQLMIDDIRLLWSTAHTLDGAKAAHDPPVFLRKMEAAVLVRRIERRNRRQLKKQGLILDGKLKTKKALQALKAKKPLKEKTAEDLKKVEKAKAAREFAAAVVKNYKMRSPRFTRTAIHGTVKPRARDYVPDPRNPALWGSGLMKDSLYAVWLPMRSYTDKKTGAQVVVNSGFQFVIQKNRHLASYRAGMRDFGIANVLRRVGSVDLSLMTKWYASYDGTQLYHLFREACRTAGKLAGLVDATMGFLV